MGALPSLRRSTQTRPCSISRTLTTDKSSFGVSASQVNCTVLSAALACALSAASCSVNVSSDRVSAIPAAHDQSIGILPSESSTSGAASEHMFIRTVASRLGISKPKNKPISATARYSAATASACSATAVQCAFRSRCAVRSTGPVGVNARLALTGALSAPRISRIVYGVPSAQCDTAMSSTAA